MNETPLKSFMTFIWPDMLWGLLAVPLLREGHLLGGLAVYTLTAAFPKPETYGLSLQIRRSAVSVPANIAEGFRRRSRVEKARFLNMAESSLEETRYFLILAASCPEARQQVLRYTLGQPL